jgi:hypothetical protein
MLILVKKKADYTCFHNHTASAPAWIHAVHLKKNTDATPHQAKKNNANQKNNRTQMQSCENSKTESLT